jgi:hypothetical protein
MIKGYARVSTDGQTLDAQESSLRAVGAERVLAEKQSGVKSQKIASDTLFGVCKTHAQPLTRDRRPFWLRWPKLGKDLPSEKHMTETLTSPFLSSIAATDC